VGLSLDFSARACDFDLQIDIKIGFLKGRQADLIAK
jgi:hypothetical protein